MTLGSTSFSAPQVARVVERAGVIVVPCANPDGRHYAFTTYDRHRGNRRAGGPVDLNRNYDIVWDFPNDFASAATNTNTLASNDPSSDLYHGPAAMSEPESRNIEWLIDTYAPQLVLDIHSFARRILYPWGIDDDQSDDPTMAFWNDAFDHQRGVEDSGYKEFLDDSDVSRSQTIAEAMADRMRDADPNHGSTRGDTDWRATQSVHFNADDFTWYPTSGSLDDYSTAWRRDRSAGAKPQLNGPYLGFTAEIGHDFHPDYAVFAAELPEYVAGFTQFCLDSIPRARLRVPVDGPRRLTVKDLWGPYGPWRAINVEIAELILSAIPSNRPAAPQMPTQRIGI